MEHPGSNDLADSSLIEMERHFQTAKLPTEILLMICQFSTKQDLKSIRLSCKCLCHLATGLLFDRVFISPFNMDLEAFREITQRPHLCRSVKTLIYSLERFKKQGMFKYLRSLETDLTEILRDVEKTFVFEHDDKWVEELLNHAQKRRRSKKRESLTHDKKWYWTRCVRYEELDAL